jgi:hypothetical protein
MAALWNTKSIGSRRRKKTANGSRQSAVWTGVRSRVGRYHPYRTRTGTLMKPSTLHVTSLMVARLSDLLPQAHRGVAVACHPPGKRRAADVRDADGPPSTLRGGEPLSLREGRLPSAASNGLAISGQLSAVARQTRGAAGQEDPTRRPQLEDRTCTDPRRAGNE